MRFGVFETATGRLSSILDLPDNPPDGAYPGSKVVEGGFSSGVHYLDNDGVVQEAEPPPVGLFYVLAGRDGWVFDHVSAAKSAQLYRDDLLRKTDWVELPSAVARLSPETLEQALTWRQALRDITDQVGYPEHINWPAAPEGLPGIQ